jgi:hypothetical protein
MLMQRVVRDKPQVYFYHQLHVLGVDFHTIHSQELVS